MALPKGKGITNNPNGRPARGRALAELMSAHLAEKINGIEAKETIVKRAIAALRTGVLDFGEKRKLKLSAKDWIDLFKYTANHVDGPVRQELLISRSEGVDTGGKLFSIPAELIAPDFLGSHRAIYSGKYTEFVESGGRGSTKSSFIAEEIIGLIINNPTMHAVALRQVKDTLRDSVYATLIWAIDILELSEHFKCTTSPMEIEYIPTGQKIYFRGADDPGKIKSIRPQFGYIGIVWFEELDQYHGPEAIRNIEQSVIRGGDIAYIFKSFNPPQTANNWANKYIKIPKASQHHHHSNYLNVPVEWLGKTFIEEAEHLQSVNPTAYEHEYLGIANNTGGAVFTNLQLRAITDEEIKVFDRILHGLDWGFYPDPASYGKMHFDSARRILYIFGELREWKKSNEALHAQLLSSGLYTDVDLLIADSAEPKSVQDFRAYGSNCRGAEKGPDSVKYSMKWLQGLTAIIIDPARAPYHAQEFGEYEYERTKDGEIISEFPDKNNHAIDDVRYATNLIWRRRGE